MDTSAAEISPPQDDSDTASVSPRSFSKAATDAAKSFNSAIVMPP